MTREYFQPIPDNLNPTGRRCVKLYIPDDPQWIRMFWGFLWGLTRWYTYERDTVQSGLQIGAVWRQIWSDSHIAFDNDLECDAPPLERLIEGWVDDMNICTNLRFNNGKLQGLCCFNDETGEMEWVDIRGQGEGVIDDTAVTPEGTNRPGSGVTTCLNRQLDANNILQFPWPVDNNDIVTISQIRGAWNDGTTAWYCPDGTPYVLNACVGVQGHAMGDPDTTAYHMQLIAFDGTAYYPVTDGVPITIAGLAQRQMLTIFANDAPLSDNAGTISFKICVEDNSAPPVGTWCVDYNFVYGSKLGFAETGTTDWTGAGFAVAAGGLDSQINLPNQAGAFIDEAILYFSPTATGPVYFDSINTGTGTSVVTVDTSGAPIEMVGTVQIVAERLSTGDPAQQLNRVVLHGHGTPPALAGNC